MKVLFLPSGKTIDAPRMTVLEAARQIGVPIIASCGGHATCGKCKVHVVPSDPDALSPPDEIECRTLSEEALACGMRLACRLTLPETGELTVRVAENRDDLGRKERISILPLDFTADCNQADELAYGMAFDIGTTTVVGMLCDLASGLPIRAIARTNPQGIYGADVISRIQYAAESSEHLQALQRKVIDCFDEIIHSFIQEEGIVREQIKKITVVGNTAMSHLFLGIDASSLARAPFDPVFTSAVTMSASDLGLLTAEDAKVYLLPNIAGHVGSDITAVMLAASLYALPGVNLVIDIGTNGEVLLSREGELLACSTAAGPAFEGASIRFGMRAAVGAIEQVDFTKGDVRLSVIGDAEPTGLCGSGLISLIAQMLGLGLITTRGRLLSREAALEQGIPEAFANRLYSDENGGGFVLHKDIVLTQKDIREVQLAKGAIAAGIEVLLDRFGLSPSEIDRVMIAGAFGNYVRVEDALGIGLLPQVSPERVVPIGNAAGVGACMALLSAKHCEIAEREAEKICHIELSNDANFVNKHMRAMSFPAKVV